MSIASSASFVTGCNRTPRLPASMWRMPLTAGPLANCSKSSNCSGVVVVEPAAQTAVKSDAVVPRWYRQ
jgi:hypothetical protein